VSGGSARQPISELSKSQPFKERHLYNVGMIRNRPFVDGNKSTGSMMGILLLELKGYRFTASEEEAAQAVLELTSGNLDESGYLAFLHANVLPEK
jgi:death on curing protein